MLSDNQTFVATVHLVKSIHVHWGVGFNANHHDLLILLQRKCSDIQYRHNHIFKIHKCSEISHLDLYLTNLDKLNLVVFCD